jgi:hypothetical protein
MKSRKETVLLVVFSQVSVSLSHKVIIQTNEERQDNLLKEQYLLF